MTRRFSPSELRFLRNRVPIAKVIDTLPGLACRTISGKFSFACPVCGGVDTGINAADNLARCFACRQNFNPIELVMRHLKIGFVDSVKWLKNDMPAPPVRQPAPASNAGNAPPAAIGNILSDVIMERLEKKPDEPYLESIVVRISSLEDHIRSLYRALNDLQSSRHE